MEMIVDLTCMGCGVEFKRSKSKHEASLRRGRKFICCSLSCVGRVKQPKSLIELICEHCDEKFYKESKYAKRKFRFCSTKCSNGSRKKALVSSDDKPFRWMGLRTTTKEIPLGDLRKNYPSPHRFHAKVRGYARRAYTGPMKCAACGYSLHVEIAHIRGVADFPDSATMAEVNAPENLVALDPRCHWEYDNGYLELKDGKWLPTVKAVDTDQMIG